MRGLVSFHAIDPEVVDGVVHPLIAGGKIRPDAFLDEALRFRRSGWRAGRYARALAAAMEDTGPPDAAAGAGLLGRVRSSIERLRHEPDPRTVKVREAIDADLHLEGRPFLILDGSSERVTTLVGEYLSAPDADAADALAIEQIARLGRDIAGTLAPEEGAGITPDFNYRRDVLDRMRVLFDLPRAARNAETWRVPGERPRPAPEALREDLAWHATAVHALVRPFWIGRDVDGIETVCRAAGVAPPGMLVPAWRLVGPALDEFTELRDALGTELSSPRSVGAYVPPEDVAAFSGFLASSGARIIQAAAQHGEGPRCSVLLKKIRECVHWAENRGWGYLEAAGIGPPWEAPSFARPHDPDEGD